MIIQSASIKNYKSFFESEKLELRTGFNILVGQNDAGKSACLEVLSMRAGDRPHLSQKSVPNKGDTPFGSSSIGMEIVVQPEELWRILEKHINSFYLPGINGTAEQNISLINKIISAPVTFEYQFSSGAPIFAAIKGFNDKVARAITDKRNAIAIPSHIDLEKHQIVSNIPAQMMNVSDTLPFKLVEHLRDLIYAFSAERLNIGESGVGATTQLASNAQNLSEVLHYLQSSSPTTFEEYNRLVSIVLPHIKQITVPPVSANTSRILLWPIDEATHRNDLTVSLSDSGTGISQVLAIIYVVLTAPSPRVILIDEPQSFLHPGAIRKLVEILKVDFANHQYITATHSQIVIASSDPSTIHLLIKKEGVSKIYPISLNDARDSRLLMTEIGASLSDVFGADNILWVEGPTEAICIPRIVNRLKKRTLLGTAIIPVRSTGDFQSKHAKAILEIYDRLSNSASLIPPAVGFLLDREDRDQGEIEDLIRQSKGKIHLTNRRMFESYLLENEGICYVLNSHLQNSRTSIKEQDLANWKRDHMWDRKYFSKEIPDKTETNWTKEVHAAKYLQDLFISISNATVQYNKIQDGIALTEWNISNRQANLEELADIVLEILDKNPNAGV
jgi:predicted ATPase